MSIRTSRGAAARAIVGDRRSPQRYAAFISYSHALDSWLASSLQRGLQTFAKPWHRVRALRVFRDQSSLSANPALWSAIERALATSDFFILMASPEAACSPWVAREVTWWRDHIDPRRCLIVLTSGELVWDGGAGDFDWVRTTAVPAALRGAFPQEPRASRRVRRCSEMSSPISSSFGRPWELDPEAWVRAACASAGRDLTISRSPSGSDMSRPRCPRICRARALVPNRDFGSYMPLNPCSGGVEPDKPRRAGARPR